MDTRLIILALVLAILAGEVAMACGGGCGDGKKPAPEETPTCSCGGCEAPKPADPNEKGCPFAPPDPNRG